MSLCSWHILQLGVACSLTLFTISHGHFSIHFSNMLLFTRLPEWAVGFCALSNELFTISFTKSKAKSALSVIESFKTLFKLTSLFPLLLMWCSWRENSWGLYFSVYTSDIVPVRFLFGRVTPFSNNDHLNTLAVSLHENLYAYRLFHLRMRTRSFNFNCVLTQIRCLSVSLLLVDLAE